MKFRELCVRYANLINSEGVAVAAYNPETITHFKSKSAQVRAQALEALTLDILILESMRAEELSIRNTRTHVSRFISTIGYQIQPDILEKIDDEDSVEVYFIEGTQQHQIYRNFRYFELTSFTIEQLFGMNWKISYIHEPEFMSDIMEAINHCLTAPRPATVTYHPREHVITEIGAPKSRTFATKMKYISPLTQDGKIRAFLSTNSSRMLASVK